MTKIRKKSLIFLARSGAINKASASEIQCLRRRFDKHHYVYLPGFLNGELLKELSQGLENAGTYRVHDRDGSESTIEENPATATFLFLANDPVLLRAMEQITGAGRLGCFMGRCYRLNASAKDAMRWHDDLVDSRRVAISVNMGRDLYAGGVLKIRHRWTKKALEEAPNKVFGDAVIFRVASFLEHCVSPVEGAHAKIAFTGWFHAGKSLFSFEKDDDRVKPTINRGRRKKIAALTDRVKISERVLFRDVRKKKLIFDSRNRACYGLDVVSGRVWDLIRSEARIQSVCNRLAREYNAPAEPVRKDILNLINDFNDNELVEIKKG